MDKRAVQQGASAIVERGDTAQSPDSANLACLGGALWKLPGSD